DLFASCGIYENSETKELGWGSPLLALHAIDPFDVYIFGDKSPYRASVLADRVDDSGLVRTETVRVSLSDPDVMRAARDFKALTVDGPKCGGDHGRRERGRADSEADDARVRAAADGPDDARSVR